MSRHRVWTTGLAALLLSAGLAACTGGNDKVVNIYSSRHYNQDDQLYKAFTDKTGIKVNVIEGKDAELIERIQSEGANSPADVLITVDAGRLWQAESKGVFQPIQSAVLNADLPDDLRDPGGRWFGFARRARVIIYNKDKVKPSQLSTYQALANPEWKGRLCMRSSDNIYNQSLVAATIATQGEAATEKWVKGLTANFARPPQGPDTAQIKAVAEGVCDVSVVNHYYVARMLDSKDASDRAVAAKVGVFFPRPTHVNVSGAGVVAKAPHKANAIAFLEFLASPEGQRYFTQGTYEYPAKANTAEDAVVRNFGTFEAAPINVKVYGANNAEAVKIMDRAGWR